VHVRSTYPPVKNEPIPSASATSAAATHNIGCAARRHSMNGRIAKTTIAAEANAANADRPPAPPTAGGGGSMAAAMPARSAAATASHTRL
jgi:hypothetical protein